MIVVLEHSIRDADKQNLRDFLSGRGFRVREIVGEEETVFGAVGNTQIDIREVEVLPGVARVIPISKPYKLASRELQPNDTVVNVGGVQIGGNRIVVIAGPCAVESREQIMETASLVAQSGAVLLRGGAFKPRSSPYSFQGLGEEGLTYLREAGDANGLPVVSEIVSISTIQPMTEMVDMFQIGTRNMQNFELLKAVGATNKPVLLKRGLAATIEEWLMAAEYLLAHGAEQVVLCERGIRTFETYTRNTLDISAIPVVKKLCHLPVLVDPSHATGIRDKVPPVGLAAIAAGADGLIVEVHTQPDRALSDGPQSLFPEQFEKLMRDVEALSPVVGREVARVRSRSGRIAGARTPAATGGEATGAVGAGAGDTPDSGAVNVGFQGAVGAFSELALRRHFEGESFRAIPHRHFRDVFEKVLSGELDYGVIPLENSLMGSIHENYDLLVQFPDLVIVGETHIRIEHSLIGASGAEINGIRKVLSQAPGIEQCRDFLNEHPDWEVVPYYDTAGAVAHVADLNDSAVAAIAGASTADLYGLTVLKEGIESNPRNYTRFAILAHGSHAAPEDANMATIVFATPDKPGALFRCMGILAERNLNMQKLESRPILGQPWQYMFYVDLQLPADPAPFTEALELLKSETRNLRVLGRYRASRHMTRD